MRNAGVACEGEARVNHGVRGPMACAVATDTSAATSPSASADRRARRRPPVGHSSPASSTAAPCQAAWSLWRRTTAAIHGAPSSPKAMARRRADGPEVARAAPATQTTPANSSQAASGHGSLPIGPLVLPSVVSRPTPPASRVSSEGQAWGSSWSAGTPAAHSAAGSHTASSTAAGR
jgi:hypothetical protein